MSGALTTLFACPAGDITLDKVQDLVAQGLPEGLTLDYKERYTPKVVEVVAAMANSYGGVVIVGVTDEAPRQVVGVEEAEATKVANGCHDTLEPPWVPEIIVVPLRGRRAASLS